jgi:uncharacterized protein involved in exopolysaccharide biosynthesis
VSTSELSIPPVKNVRVRDIGPRPDPAYVSPGRSALHHRAVVLLLIALGLVAGGGVAYQRAPVWKAQTRLIVGTTVNLTNPSATPGLAAAEIQIASNYSRLIGTATVSDGVRMRLGHGAAGSLTATPVPQSALILVSATGSTQRDATALATAGQAALVDAVNVVNQQTVAANTALSNQYQTASNQLAKDTVDLDNLQQQQSLLQSQINSLQSSINSLTSSSYSTSSRTRTLQSEIAANQQQIATLTPQLIAATSAVNVDKLKSQTLETQYAASYNPNLIAEDAVTPLGSAAPEGSNRKSNLEIGLLAGGVGGLVLGIAWASMIDIRRDNRSRPVRTTR